MNFNQNYTINYIDLYQKRKDHKQKNKIYKNSLIGGALTDFTESFQSKRQETEKIDGLIAEKEANSVNKHILTKIKQDILPEEEEEEDEEEKQFDEPLHRTNLHKLRQNLIDDVVIPVMDTEVMKLNEIDLYFRQPGNDTFPLPNYFHGFNTKTTDLGQLIPFQTLIEDVNSKIMFEMELIIRDFENELIQLKGTYNIQLDNTEISDIQQYVPNIPDVSFQSNNDFIFNEESYIIVCLDLLISYQRKIKTTLFTNDLNGRLKSKDELKDELLLQFSPIQDDDDETELIIDKKITKLFNLFYQYQFIFDDEDDYTIIEQFLNPTLINAFLNRSEQINSDEYLLDVSLDKFTPELKHQFLLRIKITVEFITSGLQYYKSYPDHKKVFDDSFNYIAQLLFTKAKESVDLDYIINYFSADTPIYEDIDNLLQDNPGDLRILRDLSKSNTYHIMHFIGCLYLFKYIIEINISLIDQNIYLNQLKNILSNMYSTNEYMDHAFRQLLFCHQVYLKNIDGNDRDKLTKFGIPKRLNIMDIIQLFKSIMDVDGILPEYNFPLTKSTPEFLTDEYAELKTLYDPSPNYSTSKLSIYYNSNLAIKYNYNDYSEAELKASFSDTNFNNNLIYLIRTNILHTFFNNMYTELFNRKSFVVKFNDDAVGTEYEYTIVQIGIQALTIPDSVYMYNPNLHYFKQDDYFLTKSDDKYKYTLDSKLLLLELIKSKSNNLIDYYNLNRHGGNQAGGADESKGAEEKEEEEERPATLHVEDIISDLKYLYLLIMYLDLSDHNIMSNVHMVYIYLMDVYLELDANVTKSTIINSFINLLFAKLNDLKYESDIIIKCLNHILYRYSGKYTKFIQKLFESEQNPDPTEFPYNDPDDYESLSNYIRIFIGNANGVILQNEYKFHLFYILIQYIYIYNEKTESKEHKFKLNKDIELIEHGAVAVAVAVDVDARWNTHGFKFKLTANLDEGNSGDLLLDLIKLKLCDSFLMYMLLQEYKRHIILYLKTNDEHELNNAYKHIASIMRCMVLLRKQILDNEMLIPDEGNPNNKLIIKDLRTSRRNQQTELTTVSLFIRTIITDIFHGPQYNNYLEDIDLKYHIEDKIEKKMHGGAAEQPEIIEKQKEDIRKEASQKEADQKKDYIRRQFEKKIKQQQIYSKQWSGNINADNTTITFNTGNKFYLQTDYMPKTGISCPCPDCFFKNDDGSINNPDYSKDAIYSIKIINPPIYLDGKITCEIEDGTNTHKYTFTIEFKDQHKLNDYKNQQIFFQPVQLKRIRISRFSGYSDPRLRLKRSTSHDTLMTKMEDHDRPKLYSRLVYDSIHNLVSYTEFLEMFFNSLINYIMCSIAHLLIIICFIKVKNDDKIPNTFIDPTLEQLTAAFIDSAHNEIYRRIFQNIMERIKPNIDDLVRNIKESETNAMAGKEDDDPANNILIMSGVNKEELFNDLENDIGADNYVKFRNDIFYYIIEKVYNKYISKFNSLLLDDFNNLFQKIYEINYNFILHSLFPSLQKLQTMGIEDTVRYRKYLTDGLQNENDIIIEALDNSKNRLEKHLNHNINPIFTLDQVQELYNSIIDDTIIKSLDEYREKRKRIVEFGKKKTEELKEYDDSYTTYFKQHENNPNPEHDKFKQLKILYDTFIQNLKNALLSNYRLLGDNFNNMFDDDDELRPYTDYSDDDDDKAFKENFYDTFLNFIASYVNKDIKEIKTLLESFTYQIQIGGNRTDTNFVPYKCDVWKNKELVDDESNILLHKLTTFDQCRNVLNEIIHKFRSKNYTIIDQIKVLSVDLKEYKYRKHYEKYKSDEYVYGVLDEYRNKYLSYQNLWHLFTNDPTVHLFQRTEEEEEKGENIADKKVYVYNFLPYYKTLIEREKKDHLTLFRDENADITMKLKEVFAFYARENMEGAESAYRAAIDAGLQELGYGGNKSKYQLDNIYNSVYNKNKIIYVYDNINNKIGGAERFRTPPQPLPRELLGKTVHAPTLLLPSKIAYNQKLLREINTSPLELCIGIPKEEFEKCNDIFREKINDLIDDKNTNFAEIRNFFLKKLSVILLRFAQQQIVNSHVKEAAVKKLQAVALSYLGCNDFLSCLEEFIKKKDNNLHNNKFINELLNKYINSGGIMDK